MVYDHCLRPASRTSRSNDVKSYDYKLYVVTWGDAYGGEMYYSAAGNHSPMVMTNVGWLCEDNDETIVLSQSFSETGRRRDLIIIPHVNIISIEELV